MIAVTMGDPNGVGPEIAYRTIPRLQEHVPLILVGDERPLYRYAKRHGGDTSIVVIDSVNAYLRGRINVLRPELPSYEVRPGVLDGAAGAASIACVDTATRLVLEEACSAVVTLPINKEAVRRTVPDFTGHTEFIAKLCGAASPVMMLASDRLRITHVSTHVALFEAIRRVTVERVLAVIRITAAAARQLAGFPGTIAVCGLNPHAGEHGAFGTEEIERIIPAIETAREEGIAVIGPEPADTIFYRASRPGSDIVAIVAMYHDQGHVPMKTLDFDGGVNVSLGLPIVRTSVDHGTAFDIAYKGIATTVSFARAVALAVRLAT